MKRRLAFLLALILILVPTVVAQATDFISWDTEVFLDDNGDAHITTRWVSDEDQGTEKYIVIDNLKEDMVLRDFQVKDERGEYQNIGTWDVHASREEKAMKCGIVTTGTGYELCWGFGTYTHHEYEFSYVIENMVQNLEDDNQMLFFTFLNKDMSEYPDRMTLRILAAEPFDEQVKMWAYGFPGEIYLVDGAIDVKSNDTLRSNSYVTILLRFEPETFSATGTVDKTFDDVLTEANKGSDYTEDEERPSESHSSSMFPVLITVILILLPIVYLLSLLALFLIRFIKKRNRLRQYRDTYYRGIPYDGLWEELFIYFKENHKDTEQNFITAFFLKWIKEGIFTPVYQEKWTKRKEYGFRFRAQEEDGMGPAEKYLYRMFADIAKNDEVITEKTMRKYLRRHEYYFSRFRWELETNSENVLKSKGYIHYKKILLQKVMNLTEQGLDLEERLMGFENYLKDYSLLEEREAYNVHLWENYMIWAAVFGIADEVERQFKELYPEIQNTNYAMTAGVVTYASSFSRSVRSAYHSSSSSSSSRSSGGGGYSSSSGGGGGSYGGGSGGGTR